MRRAFFSLAVLFLVFLLSARAEPPSAGRYTGLLKMTKHLNGMEVVSSLKAVATLTDTGNLTILLATPQSPVPEAVAPSGILSCILREKSITLFFPPLKPEPSELANGDMPEINYSVVPVDVFVSGKLFRLPTVRRHLA